MSSQKKYCVLGNWKMNVTRDEIDDLIEMLNTADVGETEVFVAPPIIYLDYVRKRLDPKIQVAAPNCYCVERGAFTGETSTDMIKDLGIKTVILGHAERRREFGENDKLTGDKISHALAAGLNVIACFGETLSERNSGQAMKVVMRQFTAIAAAVPANEWHRIMLAYEPIWATGVTATAAEAQEVHSKIRQWLVNNVGNDIAAQVRITYGGRVTAGNSLEMVKMPDIDGFQVGRSSLNSDFLKIVHANTTAHALSNE